MRDLFADPNSETLSGIVMCLCINIRFYYLYILAVLLQCVSKKNIPNIFSYNSKKHCRIFIIFGTLITEKVGNQQMI